jgi:hypothetical protein
MTIKQHGGVFGRNPSFNDVSVETLLIAGTALSSSAAELNILDGLTATTAELNILDGVTADATEINYLDGASTAAVVASKAVLADASGNIAFPDGKGIDFSATAGTGTSELFDDYEEGTWTPTLGGTTGDPTSVSYNLQNGIYTKVGRQVTVNGQLGFTTFTGGSGNLLMSGLPFAFTGTPRGVVNLHHTAYSGYIVSSLTGTSINFFENESGPSYTFIPFTGVTSNANLKLIEVTITYFV